MTLFSGKTHEWELSWCERYLDRNRQLYPTPRFLLKSVKHSSRLRVITLFVLRNFYPNESTFMVTKDFLYLFASGLSTRIKTVENLLFFPTNTAFSRNQKMRNCWDTSPIFLDMLAEQYARLFPCQNVLLCLSTARQMTSINGNCQFSDTHWLSPNLYVCTGHNQFSEQTFLHHRSCTHTKYLRNNILLQAWCKEAIISLDFFSLFYFIFFFNGNVCRWALRAGLWKNLIP